MLRKVSKFLIPIVSVVALCATTAVAEKQRPSQITPTGAEDSVCPSVADEDGTRNLDATRNGPEGKRASAPKKEE